MAIQVQGNSGVIQEVDSSWRAARVSLRPFDHGSLGHYSMAAQSGLITGVGVVAGAPLFTMRWADATRQFALLRLRCRLQVTTIFTARQEIGLDAVAARAFTASDSAGTQIVLTGNNNKMKTSQGTSLVTDARIAAATLLTAGTRTLDANPFAVSNGYDADTNAAADTAYVVPKDPELLWEPWLSVGRMPLVLVQNEGFVVRNTVAFPAAGAFRLSVEVAWAELAASTF